ncbi:HAMP domain-containing sensor histidine kinase [Paenibacillus macquariensis]|uniref:histidine kinase n=1 Tax=Paenibacillus macquariensis TaxID=948756 RepID=A0ABY1JPQ3_9BACL|nr:HAMP domain-containing histidine kinase [Paenibacillus macquariensis]MEC0094033.1 HAMP domain-containing histidine kinase [Paenibacillus macquariensis]OAB37499.1 two-component sensor histidine kinase [Paenibacillus macquariensis subsp. macquariensis]SIQ54804.1 Signal transduction histidine kinase [Paenibacillus macquariensis]
MKLRTKFTLLTSALVILILLSVDFVIYLLFINIATRNEIELLRNKSEQIIEKIGPLAIMDTDQKNQILGYLPEDSMIRIFNSDLKVVQSYQEEQDIDLNQINLSSWNDSKLLDINDQKILVVRVPIQTDDNVIGVFEIVEKMDTLESNINLLVTLLLFSTGGAVLLSVIGASFLSRTLLKPISDSIVTMREIESSLIFKKIPSRGQTNDELFHMTETFNRMMDRLEENFHKQQQFVSDASHELNTTITIIEGYANMLRRWGTNDQKIQLESIEAIYEESKQMRKMTRQLLDLASSQQNHSLNIEKFDLVACCEQVSSHVKKLQSQSIVVHSEDGEIWMVADLTKIKQLLLILIDNALKYSSRSIEIHITKDSTNVVIKVKDFGIGIAEEEIQHVFERFYRVDTSRDRKTGGTGLGLPIAQSIVTEHDGTIHIESKEGVGTEVIVFLPIEQEKNLTK